LVKIYLASSGRSLPPVNQTSPMRFPGGGSNIGGSDGRPQGFSTYSRLNFTSNAPRRQAASSSLFSIGFLRGSKASPQPSPTKVGRLHSPVRASPAVLQEA